MVYRKVKFRKLLRNLKTRLYIFLLKDTSKLNILVFGTGRGGTTWVQDLLNNDYRFRHIFEPFNRTILFVLKKRNLERFNFHKGSYVSSDAKNVTNIGFVEELFSGKLKDIIFDQKNYLQFKTRFSKGRIIKEIIGSLYLGFLKEKYPETPVIYIFRSPYSIVLSRLLRGWGVFDFDELLKQEALVKNHLFDKLDIIEKVDKSNFVINNFLGVAIEYYVVLRELLNKPNNFLFCYETIKENPLPFLAYLNTNVNPKNLFNTLNVDFANGGSGFMNQKSLSNWDSYKALASKLEGEQFRQLDYIFNAFGLNRLYNEQLLPLNKITVELSKNSLV